MNQEVISPMLLMLMENEDEDTDQSHIKQVQYVYGS
jgi:hypothetical protein